MGSTLIDGGLNQTTEALPPHLSGWELPAQWRWGATGLRGEHRHVQEIVDALGRSLALVTAPNPEHYLWLEGEARELAHRNHPSVPTTYHYWAVPREQRRGPGYLRRWIEGETIAARIARRGPEEVPYVLQVLRAAGSALVYLHDIGTVHGALAPDTVWVSPTGRLWFLGWQWAVPRDNGAGGDHAGPSLDPRSAGMAGRAVAAGSAQRSVAAGGDVLCAADGRAAAAHGRAPGPMAAGRLPADPGDGAQSRIAGQSGGSVSGGGNDAAHARAGDTRAARGGAR